MMTHLDPFLVTNGTLTFLVATMGFWLLALVYLVRRRVRYANPGWMAQVSIAIGLGAAVARVAMLKYLGI